MQKMIIGTTKRDWAQPLFRRIDISSCHNLFQLKEKQMDSCGVSLGLSLDVLIYIIRYAKLKLGEKKV